MVKRQTETINHVSDLRTEAHQAPMSGRRLVGSPRKKRASQGSSRTLKPDALSAKK